MARPFVVEGEVRPRVTDLGVAAVHRRELQRRDRAHGGVRLACVDGIGGVARQHVLDVHEQQLLVLLLMVQAQDDERGRRRVALVDQRVHRAVDVGAVPGDLVDGGTRQQAPMRARMTRPDRLVVRVEEIRVRGVERARNARGVVRAGTSRRTTWCGRDAIWWGWHRASTGRLGPRRRAVRRDPRCDPGPRGSDRGGRRGRRRPGRRRWRARSPVDRSETGGDPRSVTNRSDPFDDADHSGSPFLSDGAFGHGRSDTAVYATPPGLGSCRSPIFVSSPVFRDGPCVRT